MTIAIQIETIKNTLRQLSLAEAFFPYSNIPLALLRAPDSRDDAAPQLTIENGYVEIHDLNDETLSVSIPIRTANLECAVELALIVYKTAFLPYYRA